MARTLGNLDHARPRAENRARAHDDAEGFTLNSKIPRQLDARRKCSNREGFDWATAEALAFGALACEGHRVRLSARTGGAARSRSVMRL